MIPVVLLLAVCWLADEHLRVRQARDEYRLQQIKEEKCRRQAAIEVLTDNTNESVRSCAFNMCQESCVNESVFCFYHELLGQPLLRRCGWRDEQGQRCEFLEGHLLNSPHTSAAFLQTNRVILDFTNSPNCTMSGCQRTRVQASSLCEIHIQQARTVRTQLIEAMRPLVDDILQITPEAHIQFGPIIATRPIIVPDANEATTQESVVTQVENLIRSLTEPPPQTIRTIRVSEPRSEPIRRLVSPGTSDEIKALNRAIINGGLSTATSGLVIPDDEVPAEEVVEPTKQITTPDDM